MALLWLPAYSTGHRVLDEDHKTLFKIVNDFVAEHDMTAAHVALSRLMSYSHAHFDREIAVVAALRCDHVTHQKMHDVLLRNLRGLMLPMGARPPSTPDAEVIAKTAALLEMWVYNHVVKEDVKLYPEIKKLQEQRGRRAG